MSNKKPKVQTRVSGLRKFGTPDDAVRLSACSANELFIAFHGCMVGLQDCFFDNDEADHEVLRQRAIEIVSEMKNRLNVAYPEQNKVLLGPRNCKR